MKSKIGLILALSSLVMGVACGDDDGNDPDPGNPALVSVFPADGLSNRTATVSLIGTDTAWTDASTIDFGAGITVDTVMSAGPNGLIVELTIAPDATLGAHDVSVTDATGTTTLMAGFTVTEALTVTVTGNASQGGAPQIQIVNNDPLNPFDLGADPMTGAPNLGLEFSDPTVNVFNLTADANNITFLMATDMNAPASVDFTITNGISADAIQDSMSFDIATTTPKALTVGTDIVEALAGPFDSAVYTYTATDLETVTFAPLTTNVDGADPLAFLMDASGSYLGGFGVVDSAFSDDLLLEPGTAGFIVIYDFSGSGPVTITAPNSITDTILVANTVTEDDAANNVPGGAQVIAALPGAYLGGTFAAAADEDWFQVTTTTATPTNDLVIVTSGNSAADTVIDLFDPADTVTPLATSTDNGFFDSLTAGVSSATPIDLSAGDYLIRITPSTFAPPDPLDSDYRVIIREVVPTP